MIQRFFLIAMVTVLSFSFAQGDFDESRALLENEQNTIDIINAYGDSVVSINVSAASPVVSSEDMVNPFEELEDMFPFMPDFFRFQLPENYQAPRREGSGSGFLIDDEGHIATNYHVVAATLQDKSIELTEGSEITVVFPNYDEEIAVTVVGVNKSYDLALLKPVEPLPAVLAEVEPILLADSDAVQVGQKTIAIGNPFSYSSTVTAGIVSAVSRDFRGIGAFDIPMIQTDAAINPGNSGGPLLNSAGKVIGINTAIFSSSALGASAGNIGIGFAVPSNLLKENLETLKAGGFSSIYTTRPRLGVSIRDVAVYPRAIRESLGLPDDGVAVMDVQEGSPADKAGLRGSSLELNIEGQAVPAPGDVIIAIDGEAIETGKQLQDIIFAHEPNDTVTVTLVRRGQEQDVEVELEVVPAPEESSNE